MISIIIPVINEEDGILKLFSHLQDSSSNFISEVIIVDGGSHDNTKTLVKEYTTAKLISSQKGRARQMNAGAKAANSEILYFPHADSYPPQDFDKLIATQVQRGNKAGCFCMRFDNPHWLLKFSGWCTRFNYKICRGGDQSLFISRALFEKTGGINEDFIIYEDNDFIKKLCHKKQFTIIKKHLMTSARRYKEYGVWKLQYFFSKNSPKKMLWSQPRRIVSFL